MYISDLLATFIQQGQTFDCIVSNPPYVPREHISKLSREVQKEPRIALDGGPEGLDLIQQLIQDAPKVLNPQGRIFLEAAPFQAKTIQALLKKNGFCEIESYPDLSGALRCTAGTLGTEWKK